MQYGRSVYRLYNGRVYGKESMSGTVTLYTVRLQYLGAWSRTKLTPQKPRNHSSLNDPNRPSATNSNSKNFMSEASSLKTTAQQTLKALWKLTYYMYTATY